MTAFGQALDHELKAKGLNQTDLARMMGLTSSAVSGWVTGAKSPGKANAQRIEELLDVQPRGSLRRLLVAPDSPMDLPVEHYIRSDETIPEEDRFALLRIMRNIRVAVSESEPARSVIESAESHGEAGSNGGADASEVVGE